MAKRATKRKPARDMKPQHVRIMELARAVGVPEEQIARGCLEETMMVDLDGSLGGRRMSMVNVLVNRGGTAVERWLANDRQRPVEKRIFGEGEERAIRYCQNLWARVSGNIQAIDPGADRVDQPLGWAQQEAWVEIKRIQARVPDQFWNCYENVVRFDEEAGAAGSRLATNSRSAIDAAKTTVAFTASLIAMWRRL